MIETRHTKTVRVGTHGKRALEEQSKQRRAATYENHCFSARMCNTRQKHSHQKLKIMFNPFGLRVPSLRINFTSCCLQLMLLPVHCFKPQTMMSPREWEAELKCSATGNPRDQFRILRRCSLKRSRSRLPVSPIYRQLQRRLTECNFSLVMILATCSGQKEMP